MRFLVLVFVFFQFIYADSTVEKLDEQKTINELYKLIKKKKNNSSEIEALLSELNRIQLTNKVIDVNNLALDVDTDNKVLNEKVGLLKDHIEFVLAEQQKRYESLSENQRQMFETKIELLWWNIGLVGTLIAIIISLYGYNRLKKKINKTVAEEIMKNHKKETKKLIQSLANEKEFIELIKAEIDNMEMDEDGEDGEDESFDGGKEQ